MRCADGVRGFAPGPLHDVRKTCWTPGAAGARGSPEVLRVFSGRFMRGAEPLPVLSTAARAPALTCLFLSCAQLTCQTSRPVVLCVWFQSYIRRSSVSFPGTRSTKEAGLILHPSAPVRKRRGFRIDPLIG